MQADVVIPGAGLAGLVAAIEARSHGADALVSGRLAGEHAVQAHAAAIF